MVTVHLALLVVAAICFILAALNVKTPINLVALGLLSWLVATVWLT